MLSLPNILTLSRIFAVPILVALLSVGAGAVLVRTQRPAQQPQV